MSKNIQKNTLNQQVNLKNTLSRRITETPAPATLAGRIASTYSYIGDGFYDSSVITLTSAKALSDAPDFAKDYLANLTKSVPDNFYTTTSGEDELVDALSCYGKKLDLAYTDKSNIAITAGAVNAFYSLCYALCDQGDVILTLSPSYILFANAARTFGAEMVLVPSRRNDKFSIHPKDLEDTIAEVQRSGRTIKGLFVVNPTNIDSQPWTENDIDALAPVLERHQFPIIEDRVYDGLQYDRSGQEAFFSNHPMLKEKTITIDSVSKRYGATQWRIGWIFGPGHIINAAKGSIMQTVWSPNSKYQTATALMLFASMSENERHACQQSQKTKELVSLSATYATAHKEYFSNLNKEYASRRDLCLYLIQGKEKYNPSNNMLPAAEIVRKFGAVIERHPDLHNGTLGFAAPILPRAGMFMLLEADQGFFDALERFGPADLLLARLLYKEAGVMMLPPTELTLPEGTRMYRMEFGIEIDDLVGAFSRLNAFSEKFKKLSAQDIEEMVMKHAGHLLQKDLPAAQEQVLKAA